MLIAAVYGVAASLLAWRAGPLLLRLMTPDDATVRYGAAVLAIMSAGSACTGVAQIQATCAQAVGRRLAATVLSLVGQVIVFIPVATALAARFGPAGIWWAFPASAAVAAVAGSWWTWRLAGRARPRASA